MSLEAELKKWMADPKNQKRIAEAKAQKLKAGQKFGQGSGAVSIEQARKMGEEMRDILYVNLPSGLKASISTSDIIVSAPKVQADGSMLVELSFRQEALERKSLDPEKYPEGVDNIIRLFSRGYTAHGDVVGMWHGHEQWNLRHRAADPFMQNAVDEFNALHGGAGIAELRDDYKA